MNRLQRHHRAVCDQSKAGHNKPPTRAQAKAWLAPIRKAFVEMVVSQFEFFFL